jgi:hypothetical protein
MLKILQDGLNSKLQSALVEGLMADYRKELEEVSKKYEEKLEELVIKQAETISLEGIHQMKQYMGVRDEISVYISNHRDGRTEHKV